MAFQHREEQKERQELWRTGFPRLINGRADPSPGMTWTAAGATAPLSCPGNSLIGGLGARNPAYVGPGGPVIGPLLFASAKKQGRNPGTALQGGLRNSDDPFRRRSAQVAMMSEASDTWHRRLILVVVGAAKEHRCRVSLKPVMRCRYWMAGAETDKIVMTGICHNSSPPGALTANRHCQVLTASEGCWSRYASA